MGLWVESVIAGEAGVGCGHQAGGGEVCVGQELRLLVQGEGGLLVGRLEPRSGVRVPHAPPNGAAGVGAPHAAAGCLIHGDKHNKHSLTHTHTHLVSLTHFWSEVLAES